MCRELSAARALRRLLVSCPCVTAPNQEAMAKCAARALFLSPSWEQHEETHFPRDQRTQQKQLPKRSKKHIPKKHAAPLTDRGPASQPNNLDLEGVLRQSNPQVHGGVSGLRSSTSRSTHFNPCAIDINHESCAHSISDPDNSTFHLTCQI